MTLVQTQKSSKLRTLYEATQSTVQRLTLSFAGPRSKAKTPSTSSTLPRLTSRSLVISSEAVDSAGLDRPKLEGWKQRPVELRMICNRQEGTTWFLVTWDDGKITTYRKWTSGWLRASNPWWPWQKFIAIHELMWYFKD